MRRNLRNFNVHFPYKHYNTNTPNKRYNNTSLPKRIMYYCMWATFSELVCLIRSFQLFVICDFWFIDSLSDNTEKLYSQTEGLTMYFNQDIIDSLLLCYRCTLISEVGKNKNEEREREKQRNWVRKNDLINERKGI